MFHLISPGCRQLAAAVVAVAMLGTILGCQLNVEEPPALQGPMKLTSAELNCLEGALPTIQRYFSGKVSAGQVSEAWNCAAGALDSFLVNTRGSNAQYYTGGELRMFMQEYFLGDLRISDGLLLQFMIIKQLVVGGQRETVTRDELRRFRDIIHLLKTESIKLLPHIRYIANTIEPSEASQRPLEVERALTEFQASLVVLGELLSQSHAAYSLHDFEKFLREFEALYSRPNEWKGPSWVIDRVSTIIALKAFYLRPQGDVVQPHEWRELISAVGRLYGSYLRYRYFLTGRELLAGDGLDHTTLIAQDVFVLLEKAVKEKPSGVIDYATIEAVIDEFIRIKVLQLPLKTETFKQLVRAASDKILNPPIDRFEFQTMGVIETVPSALGRRIARGGVDETTLAAGKKLVFGWLEMQKLWRELGALAIERDSTLIGRPIPLELVREIWPGLKAIYRESYEDLSAILLRKDVPLTFTADDTVVFEREPKAHTLDQAGFNSLNWKVHGVRAAVQGYAVDPQASRYKGFEKPEWLAFFADLTPAAVELKFIAPDDKELPESLFTELNIFTLSADGDNRLSFAEGADFVAYAVSSSYIWHKAYDDLTKSCDKLEHDVFGLPKIALGCFRKRLRQNFATVFDRLPRWVKMTTGYTASHWRSFTEELERASRKDGISENPIDTTDLSRTSMVMHYIEAVFTRFDANRSGVLSRPEADRAYPLLRGILAEVSGFTDEDDLYPLFTYLLHYGEAPTRTIGGGLKWLWWKSSPSEWTISADRRMLLRILANLNEARRNPRAL